MSTKGNHCTVGTSNYVKLAPFHKKFYSQACLPLLRKSSSPRVLAISSFLGSISKNLPSESNFYMTTSYRCSKSALNQLIKCFSLDIPEVTKLEYSIPPLTCCLQVSFLAVSPGHVQTDMGNASGRTAPLTVDHVAKSIADLTKRMDKKMSGTFVDFEGLAIPYWTMFKLIFAVSFLLNCYYDTCNSLDYHLWCSKYPPLIIR